MYLMYTEIIMQTVLQNNSFLVTVHASVEDQKDQRYMLTAAPFDTVPMLLEKAVKRFNRTLGPGKEQAIEDDYILKVGYLLTISCF